MKILLISSKWPTSEREIDGGAMTAINVIDAISGHAHIDLLLPDEFLNINIPGIDNILCYPVSADMMKNHNGANRFSYRIKIANIISEMISNIHEKYDVIIVLHVFHAFVICNGSNDALQKKVVLFPMLLTPSYVESGESVPPTYTQLEYRALNNAGKIITPSDFERDQLIKNYNVNPQKILAIPRYVGRNFKYFENNKEQNSSLNICYIASIKKQKQNIKAVELLAKILEKIPNTYLYLVGPVHDKTEYDKLLNFINEYNLYDHVIIKNNIPQCEVNQLFSSCLINISVARCETFGRSIIEGLFCGLPAFVLKDTKCFLSLIGKENGTEYFDSVDAMADRIVEVYKNPIIYKKLSYKAHKFGMLFEEKKIKSILKKALLC